MSRGWGARDAAVLVATQFVNAPRQRVVGAQHMTLSLRAVRNAGGHPDDACVWLGPRACGVPVASSARSVPRRDRRVPPSASLALRS